MKEGLDKAKESLFETTLVVPSRREEAIEIADLVSKKLMELGWTKEEVGGFELAVDEAVANAVVHGNKADDNKKVTVRTALSREGASVTVEDEGEGFDEGGIPDPLAEANLLKESGRGIFLMKRLCDSVLAVKKTGSEPSRIVITKLRNKKAE